MSRAATLEAFQNEMAAALLGRGPPPASIVGDAMPAPLRFGIHRNNVIGSLTRAIEAAFPATRAWLGDGRFRAAAVAFVHACPPSRPQLSAYGAALPEFLALTLPGAYSDAAAALARFEWARHSAYFAADAPTLSANMLQGLAAEDYPRIRLTLHPSVRLVAFHGDVLRLWRGCIGGHAPYGELESREQRILVSCLGAEVLCREIGPGEAALLDAIAAGDAIGRAADRALSAEPDFDLRPVLAWQLRNGMFGGFDLANAEEM
jgi:hypothetical protein